MRGRYPRTHAQLAPEVLEHLQTLEDGFLRKPPIAIAEQGGPDADARPDYDVALAGGGLSLVYAAWLARAGCKVVVFDRRRIGCGHREWNISRAELEPLVASGLFTDGEVARLVLTEYARGVVRWHGGGTYPVQGVLDCVVDAEALLDGLRARAEAAGAALLDHHPLAGYRVGPGGVEVALAPAGRAVTLTARLLVDGLGAASPHAAFDLCCPTVGGVLTGLDAGSGPGEVDPRTGEILVTTEDIEEGHQHIWEGFPAPGGRYTTYLFYYTEPQRLPEHPLFALYERFFATRPRYKRGEARVEKPTYGFIPAYTRLRPMPVAPRDRVVLVGDAAGRHSPLTFCGFGATIRSFLPVARGLRARLEDNRLGRRDLADLVSEPPGLLVMGGLTLMMVTGRRPLGAGDVNRLLDAAFASLHELGNDVYAAFVRDEIGFRDFVTFMRRTAERRPGIYGEVFRQLSRREIARWTLNLSRLGLATWASGSGA